MMQIRGIRGAITVKKNVKAEIISATTVLLRRMVADNRIKPEDIACVIFSATKDLNAEFPANAARKIGWTNTPLLCTNEIDVPGSMKKCIRVLMLANSKKTQKAIKHLYLGGAKDLRPDLR